MQYNSKLISSATASVACLVVGVYKTRKLSAAAETLDKAAKGALTAVLKAGDLDGDVGQTQVLRNIEGIKATRVVLVGLGAKSELSRRRLRQAIVAAAKLLAGLGGANATFLLSEETIKGLDAVDLASDVVTSVDHALYQYDATKSKKAPARKLKSITVGVTKKAGADKVAAAVKAAVAIAHGVSFTRELGNLPGNVCTPTYLANQGKALAKEFSSITTKVLGEAEMKKLGMGSLLSVSRGSVQPAKLVIMEYGGGRKGDKPQVLVGKGLTFDSGGISLKPGASMDAMKMDMCGGATVFGVMRALAEMKLKLNVVGIVPASENMPDADASKPGDVVTAMDGTTIEVLNTDAEGRLILCDALCYAARYEPAALIDMATLTGAVVVALGNHNTAVLANNDKLAQQLIDAGQKAGDGIWQLPLGEEYHEQLKSSWADLANIGGAAAGTITAASFLSHFTRKQNWAHLDIAGTAMRMSGVNTEGATGRPVLALMRYLIDRA